MKNIDRIIEAYNRLNNILRSVNLGIDGWFMVFSENDGHIIVKVSKMPAFNNSYKPIVLEVSGAGADVIDGGDYGQEDRVLVAQKVNEFLNHEQN